jgi:hypothetical protein
LIAAGNPVRLGLGKHGTRNEKHCKDSVAHTSSIATARVYV